MEKNNTIGGLKVWFGLDVQIWSLMTEVQRDRRGVTLGFKASTEIFEEQKNRVMLTLESRL